MNRRGSKDVECTARNIKGKLHSESFRVVRNVTSARRINRNEMDTRSNSTRL